MKRTIALLAITSPLLLSACNDSEAAPSAQPTATVTATVTAEPTPEPVIDDVPTEPAPANIGDDALNVGEWREGIGLRSRVIEVRQPGDPGIPTYLADDDTAQGAVAKVRQCARDDAPNSFALNPYFEWTAQDESGGTYEVAGSSWEVWPPLPQYPTSEHVIQPGKCIEGWLLFAMPRDGKAASIALGDGAGTLNAEWLTR